MVLIRTKGKTLAFNLRNSIPHKSQLGFFQEDLEHGK